MTPVPDAIRIVLEQTALVLLEQKRTPATKSSFAPWNELLHQTLAEDVIMSEPGYPTYNASIMDGYAIRVNDFFHPQHEDLNSADSGTTWTHHVLDKILPGMSRPLQQQTKKAITNESLPPAYYVTTGAIVPDTFDCIVPFEECVVSKDGSLLHIQSNATIQEWKWIRRIGSDIPAGFVVLARGHTLDPVAIGLIRQSGVQQVKLLSPLTVGVLSTGNELMPECLDANSCSSLGRIPDVNRPILLSLLSSSGTCQAVDLGVARDDDIPSLVSTLRSAMDTCDVIISTGGISMGESDVVEQALVDYLGGKLHFGRLHMKPGKPTTFCTIPHNFEHFASKRLVFALPGNPVSATVCAQLLVRPCLDMYFSGGDVSADSHGESVADQVHRLVSNAWVHPEMQAVLSHDVKLDVERPEYHRVTIKTLPNGMCEATSTGIQQSSRLMSLRDAEGLLILPQAVPDRLTAKSGESYTLLVLRNDKRKRVQVRDSLHLSVKKSKSFSVGIVAVVAPDAQNVDLSSLSDSVQKALSGSRSGNVSVISARTFSGSPDDLFSFILLEQNADVLVATYSAFAGSFRHHLDVNSELRKHLTKVADAMALQARWGAAGQDASCAAIETLVGYVPNGRGFMLICLSEMGVVGGLENVRGLLKHALTVARDE